MINKLNVVKYTSIELGGLVIPLKIDISKIREAETYMIPSYDTLDVKPDGIYSSENGFPDFFYGKFRNELQICFILEKLHDFIDYDSMNKVKYLSKHFPKTKEHLIENILDSSISLTDIKEIYAKLQYTMEIVKNEFMNNVIEILEISETKYPKIELKDSMNNSKTYKAHSHLLRLNTDFITLQSFIEYDATPLFSENIGKGAIDFSWREKELRRLYIKSKTEYDSFYELLKGKMTEEFREAMTKS